MKLCIPHRSALRTKLALRGIHSDQAFYKAEALTLQVAIATELSILGHPGCPICALLVPSWLDQAARTIASATQG